MSDGSLSQDEIDALLQGSDDSSLEVGSAGGMGMQSDSPLQQNEVNAFHDLLNSTSNNAAEALGILVSKQVKLTNPRIEIVNAEDVGKQLPADFVEIKMDYDTGIIGEHEYILDINTAKIISGLMMGQEGGDLTDAALSAICEAMNTITGNISTSIGNTIKKEIRTAPPVSEIKTNKTIALPGGLKFVKVVYSLALNGNTSSLIELFSINVVKDITGSILPASSDMTGFQGSNTSQQQQQQYQMKMQNQAMMMGQQGMGSMNMMQGNRGPTQVQNVQFSNFNEYPQDNQGGNINLLMDVTMDLTVELGRTKRSIKYILGMGEGTVLELDKLAGEPVDILVNGKLIARGEVVVIDENFGVRVTEIISPADRLQELT